MGTTEWEALLSDTLRLDVRIEAEKGVPTKFGLQLCGLFGDEWVQLVRYDNAHDGPAHRHIMKPDGTEQVKDFLAVVEATFIGNAQDDLRENAETYYEEYRRLRSNQAKGR